MSVKHVMLVDGYGFLFRAYHSLPPLTRPDGLPVGALYGFANMLYQLRMKQAQGAYMGVMLDSGEKTFRHTLYPAYKSHRPQLPEELCKQFPLIKEATQALSIPTFMHIGYEADDIIATYTKLARAHGFEVTIVSSDKDLMQLIEPGVSMFDPMKSQTFSVKEAEEKWGVAPKKIRDVLALMGDASDNIPGVPGIGLKTAIQLIHQYGDLETILREAEHSPPSKRRENLLGFQKEALLSYELAGLFSDVPITYALEEMMLPSLDNEKWMDFLKEYHFHSLLKKFEKNRPVPSLPVASDATPFVHQSPAGKQNFVVIKDIIALKEKIASYLHASFWAMECIVSDKNGLDATKITSILCAISEEEGFLVVIRPMSALQLSEEGCDLLDVLDVLRPGLMAKNILKISHDSKRMIRLFSPYNVALAPTEDVMLLSYMLEAGVHDHSLEKIKTRYAIEPNQEAETQSIFQNIIDVARLYPYLRQLLFKAKLITLYERVERPLIPILAKMEDTGIKINKAFLYELSRDLTDRMNVIEKKIHEACGIHFNVASPKQLGDILFEHLSILGGKKSKSGAYSTDSDVLENLALQGIEIAQDILDWRQLAKLKSTYTESLADQCDIHDRVHTNCMMAVTSTGRLSSTKPNLQNIPIRSEEGQRIRQAFIAETKKKLVSADYSQIELRLLAHMADIAPLKQAFVEKKDIHAMTASALFNVSLEDVDATMRRKAKTINFGIIYGISGFGLARQLKISRAEASDIIAAYMTNYPGIEMYMKKTLEQARTCGYVTTLWGRRCHIPMIHDKNAGRRQMAERAAINAPLQGTAADMIKKAMICVSNALQNHPKKLDASIILQVHDELLLEVGEHDVREVALLTKHHMENIITLDVPIIADISFSSNWKEMQELTY